MNFYQMEIFLEVVKLRSVTKAAKKLLLSQPAVTIHIRKLENEINCRLLNTKRGNYSLTPEGKRFFRFAEYVSREKPVV